MEAKTIFLNDKDEIIIYESKFHYDNHDGYMKKYYSNLKITEYVPILLSKRNHCIIDLSEPYFFGTIYLPNWMSEIKKEYFQREKLLLSGYTLYLYSVSLEDPISMVELLNTIDQMPIRPKKRNYN